MNVDIQTIPHKDHRYETVGDWYYTARPPVHTLHIRVSKMSDWRYEFLVAVHEFTEAVLCAHHRISAKKVDAFDKAYEAARPHGDESEPGDDPRAPYHREHQIACGIERVLAALLGVDWVKYNKEVDSLGETTQ